jgi:putative transposase
MRASNAASVSRTALYRRPRQVEGDAEIKVQLNDLMGRWPRWGFWKCFYWLRSQGRKWNHKKVWRIYCNMKLNLPRRKKRMLLTRERQPLKILPIANHSWSLDFMHDTLNCGKRFRTLNVLDEGVRECLDIEIDTSLPSSRVVRVLERIREWRGLPQQLRLDNGPELISSHLIEWCKRNNVEMLHIQPGKPNQNAFIERFNRTFRNEVLNLHLFTSLQQVREIAWEWMNDYNEQRPHESLNNMTPTAYKEKVTAENSNLKLCA